MISSVRKHLHCNTDQHQHTANVWCSLLHLDKERKMLAAQRWCRFGCWVISFLLFFSFFFAQRIASRMIGLRKRRITPNKGDQITWFDAMHRCLHVWCDVQCAWCMVRTHCAEAHTTATSNFNFCAGICDIILSQQTCCWSVTAAAAAVNRLLYDALIACCAFYCRMCVS